jgi:predicted ester cyclase
VKEEQMSQRVERLQEIFRLIDVPDPEAAVALMGEGVRLSMPGATDLDGEGFVGYTQVFRDAFDGGTHTLVECIEQGDTLAAEGTWTGTHTGTMATPQGDVPPTGKTVLIHWAGVFRKVGEPGAEAHIYFDQMEFAAQLGLVPANA